MTDRGQKHSPNPNQGGINRQLRKAGVFMGPDYHNPNPWVRLLGRANESEIEIDGVISKAFNRQWCNDFNDR